MRAWRRGTRTPERGAGRSVLVDVMILALLIALVLVGVLWARERRGRALSEHTSDLVALCDAGGRIRAVSSSCRTVLGYAPAELKGHSALDLVHIDDRCRVRELFHAHGSLP